MRTLGPVLGGWGLGAGLRAGVVGAVWWALAAVAAVGWLASGLVYEGSGHELSLEGEEGGKLGRMSAQELVNGDLASEREGREARSE